MITLAAYGTVSDIEILWTLVAATGLFFSIFNVIDARGDWSWLNTSGVENGRRILARANLISEYSRGIKQGIFLLVGILAMILPETPSEANLPFLQVAIGFAIRWGLIIASILTTAQSFIGWRVRQKLKTHPSEG